MRALCESGVSEGEGEVHALVKLAPGGLTKLLVAGPLGSRVEEVASPCMGGHMHVSLKRHMDKEASCTGLRKAVLIWCLAIGH